MIAVVTVDDTTLMIVPAAIVRAQAPRDRQMPARGSEKSTVSIEEITLYA